MNKFLNLIVLFIAIPIALSLLIQFTLAQNIKGKVRVIDGDTLEFLNYQEINPDNDGQTLNDQDIKANKLQIRIHGIDAPELHQSCKLGNSKFECGQVAKYKLLDKIRDETINCQKITSDRFNRIVAKCQLNQEDLGAWMVSQGWAFSYHQFSNDYLMEEDSAEISIKGFWASKFVVPSKWRTGERLDNLKLAQSVESCKIKGNISSNGEKIFHIPGGRWYEKTKIDTANGERMFCSEQEAISAGWRKAIEYSDPQLVDESCIIKGNISSKGEKIYHVPGGRWYGRTKIDTTKGERMFCTEQEAVSAGWRKSYQ